jgi:hypothetical protein
MADEDSDTDSWIHLDFNDSSDAGVRSLSSGCTTPDCRSDDEHHLGLVDNAEEVPTAKPLSGLFHHMLTGGVSYLPFDPVRAAAPHKDLIPDPSFSACAEEVTILASNRSLVCLRANASADYIVANPATYSRVRLPRHSCDHLANGDPAAVITFEDANRCCADHGGHYHVVVAFTLRDGIYAYESFSSRTWEWTVGAGVSAVDQAASASGVGTMGRAFWCTTLGYILCYNPAADTDRLVPAPEEVLQWPHWELGEMDAATLSVACMDDRVTEVVVLKVSELELEHGGGKITWSMAAHFEGGCLRNRDRVELLRSQGPELVMWDPTLELVVAMGRTTRTIGPLSALQYYSDFIPFVSSSTGITRSNSWQYIVSLFSYSILLLLLCFALLCSDLQHHINFDQFSTVGQISR